MTRYVFRGGQFVHPSTGEPMPIPEREGLVTPMIRSDIEDYISPIDGKRISSRSGQRYDLQKNDCVLAPPSKRKFDREEYTWRKSQQAKVQEERKAAFAKAQGERNSGLAR